ncbi:MAG: hypothetical protein FJ280_15270 [Planctomycetes bacterium]|nr:hypothetical protein [Planctomycetota bacterium]
MGKTKASNEPIAEAGTGTAPTEPASVKSLHDEVLDLQAGLNALSLQISERNAVIEKAVRLVQEHRREEQEHLASYQRYLLSGEPTAADGALAKVTAARKKVDQAAAAVRTHAGAGAELRSEWGRVYAELIRLLPLAEEAFNQLRGDRSLLSLLHDTINLASATIRRQVDDVLCDFEKGVAAR